MFYIRPEGLAVKNGFNFYPLRDTGSAGFIFKLGTRGVCIRYSKKTGKFFVKYHHADPKQYGNLYNE